jgi:hypothetical protein
MIALTIAIAACGEASTNNLVSPNNVFGIWTYIANNVTSSGVTCNLTGVSMSLRQSGNTVTGSVTRGTSSCAFTGGSSNNALDGLTIVNGTINGHAVQFDIGTPDIHSVGTLTGNSISGMVTIHVTVKGSTTVLTGPFSATRQ